MQTRRSTRCLGISDAEGSSTQSPIKKRKISLSLKKLGGNVTVQVANTITPEPTAAVRLESTVRSYLGSEVKYINIQEVNTSVSSPESKCKSEPQHTCRPNPLQSTSLPVRQQSKLTDLQQSSDGYYLYNFKFILDLVLQSSPERHVIVTDGVPVAEQFKQLPRELNCITFLVISNVYIHVGGYLYGRFLESLSTIVQQRGKMHVCLQTKTMGNRLTL